jgi:hypothetical protein
MQIVWSLYRCVVVIVVGVCTVGLLAVTTSAQNAFTSGSTGADGALVFYTPPPSRQVHAMVYDAGRQRVVLFSGASNTGNDLNDTWEYDGTTWLQRTPATSPGVRQHHAMVYDAGRQRVVLFGGALNGNPLNDTWEYDGTTWAQRTPATAPSERYGHAMAYDAGRQRVVLFGGITSDGFALNDTWEYDGTTWAQRTPATSPGARLNHAMVYDAGRQRVVLFGGFALNDTWEYDGTTWTQRTPATSPGILQHHAMAYDAGRQRVVLFGGYLSSNDTWEYDGTTWAQRTPVTAPPGRSGSAMAYDSTHQVTVLFGGNTGADFLNDTWLWDGTTWSAPAQVQPSVVIDMSSRPDGIWHYTTIDIRAGTKISFKRNAANTPVVWLATGLVHIAGEINLDGALSAAAVDPGNEAPGGPGGGAGGLGGRRFDVSGSYAGTAGEGPGGGLPGTVQSEEGGGGGYGTPGAGALGGPAYGNRLVRPLLGGSGGGGGASSDTLDGVNGGGGGGALLIASSDTIRVSGSIHANGGDVTFCNPSCGGGGSGGAIRLVANRIEGTGSLAATGGFSGGGEGRIRLEAFFVPSSLNVNSFHTSAPPLTTGLAAAGLIRITNVAGQVVPNPPSGNTSTPDVIFTTAGDITVDLATTNIPPGTPLTVRVTAAGQVITVQSTPTDAAGNAAATVTVPAGVGTIQAFATYVPAP